jgi:hypothetical protein
MNSYGTNKKIHRTIEIPKLSLKILFDPEPLYALMTHGFANVFSWKIKLVSKILTKQ